MQVFKEWKEKRAGVQNMSEGTITQDCLNMLRIFHWFQALMGFMYTDRMLSIGSQYMHINGLTLLAPQLVTQAHWHSLPDDCIKCSDDMTSMGTRLIT